MEKPQAGVRMDDACVVATLIAIIGAADARFRMQTREPGSSRNPSLISFDHDFWLRIVGDHEEFTLIILGCGALIGVAP